MTNDFSIKQAMETAVSQAESFDQSDYAAGDLVPIFRPNAQSGRDELVGKIPKSYFMQAAIASMKDLLRSANLGTNIDKVPTLNANSFGSTSIADLASVLGGQVQTYSGTSLDDLKTQGLYTGGSSLMPQQTVAVVQVIVTSGNRVTQICYQPVLNRTLERHYNGSVWDEWQENSLGVPAFYKNYNDFNALFTALCGTGYTRDSGFLRFILHSAIPNQDLNDAPSGTITILPNNSGISNSPYPMTQHIVITLGWGADRIMQVCFAVGQTIVKTRFKADDTYSPWSGA